MKEGLNLTLEEYGKSNYRFLDKYQSMLFISNGAVMSGSIVTINNKGEYNLVYLFEKNEFNNELLNKYHKRQLTWGDKIVKFE